MIFDTTKFTAWHQTILLEWCQKFTALFDNPLGVFGQNQIIGRFPMTGIESGTEVY